jgi:hypothetical protein
MNYEPTPYGAAVALADIASGYSIGEAAAHIALTTLAWENKETRGSLAELTDIPHATRILEVLRQLKDSGLMHPTQWQNDSNAVWKVAIPSAEQGEWIRLVLADPIAGVERLAKRVTADNTK